MEASFDIHSRADLPFPNSLVDFQRLFPDDAACAAYLERIRWPRGFTCPRCREAGDPFRFTARPGVLRCRKCRKDTGLTAGTVMERTRTPLSVWFWGAYLVSTHTAGMSAMQFQRQLGLTRYETAFQILHKLRSGMVRPGRDRIGGQGHHVEVDETWVGGRTKGEGRGVHDMTLVAAAVETKLGAPKKSGKKAIRAGYRAGRLRLMVAPDRTRETLCGFVEANVMPGAMVITDHWAAYKDLPARGYEHLAINSDSAASEDYLPMVHLVFSNLKSWLLGCHHSVSGKHLQAYLNEFTFRFNRRFYPFNTFRSLLGIGSDAEPPTYRALYDGGWEHPTIGHRPLR